MPDSRVGDAVRVSRHECDENEDEYRHGQGVHVTLGQAVSPTHLSYTERLTRRGRSQPFGTVYSSTSLSMRE